MQGEGQCRYVVWIISLALQIHWDPRVLLGDNKLVSMGSMKRDDGGLQQLYVIWCSFYILGKSFARPFEVKRLPLTGSCFS